MTSSLSFLGRKYICRCSSLTYPISAVYLVFLTLISYSEAVAFFLREDQDKEDARDVSQVRQESLDNE
jgi:hypothetical protein